jgi:hypothetical protein
MVLAVGLLLPSIGCGKAGAGSLADGSSKTDAPASQDATGTTAIAGTGGATNVCAGKGGNCHPYPMGCQGSQCINCPCEGGTGGAPGRGGAGGGFVTGGTSGVGGRDGLDAREIISCYDATGVKASMKACSTVDDCRQGREVNCCGTDRILGLATTANCGLNAPDCSFRACMKWTYVTAEDGKTTETGGMITLLCVAGQCSTQVILPYSVDGGSPDR